MDQKNILCFGDSNTHGYNSKTGGRFTVEERWTKLLQRNLGDDYYVIEEGIACANAGADFVGTTMRGYTSETQGCDDIDFDFIHELSEKCPAKIIAEGHIHYPEQAKKALEAGAFALVVGGAITRPAEITARFVAAIEK